MLEPTALVLVGVVNNPRDLEIARLLGWYRIPLRSAPKVIAVDYLAFYQTGAFGEEKWQIQYLAPVRGHELTTRAELLRTEPDHPRAKEEYYKIQIGALEHLPQPILAGSWRRVTFLYTTGEYLLKAASLKDLVVQSDERQVLWQALRERAEKGYGASELPETEIPDEVLALLIGIREGEEPYDEID
jgi:hypothetical protein